jgi:hypothetical protein
MNPEPDIDGPELFSAPRRPWVGWLVLGIAMLVILYPSPVMPWAPPPKPHNAITEADSWEFGSFLQANTPSDAVVVSDAYWLVSWYGNRTSVWFPLDLRSLYELNDRLVHVDAVFLTPSFVGNAQTNPVWLGLYSRPSPFGEFTDVREFKSKNGYRVVLYQRKGAAQ